MFEAAPNGLKHVYITSMESYELTETIQSVQAAVRLTGTMISCLQLFCAIQELVLCAIARYYVL